MNKISNATFQINKLPVNACSGSFIITKGTPASNVPAGQMYLQNPGSNKTIGITITNTTKITYFK